MSEQNNAPIPEEQRAPLDALNHDEWGLHLLASAEISIRGLKAIFDIGAHNASYTWRRLQRGKSAHAVPEEGEAPAESSDNS